MRKRRKQIKELELRITKIEDYLVKLAAVVNSNIAMKVVYKGLPDYD